MDILSSASLRRLRVFLVVCDTMHMARAAERLEIAQPSLSQQIRSLEDAIGVKLFHRRKRGIDLTVAGSLLRCEATRLLEAHALAIDDVRRTARGEMGRIALGYVGSAMSERELPAQLKAMRETYPEVELTLREASVAPLVASLKAGELDVALIRAPMHIEPPLQHKVHSRQRLVVILPSEHPLAVRKRISIAQLAPYPMVGYPDFDNDVGIMQIVAELAHRAGVEIHARWKVSEVGSVLGLVAAGLGFGIVPQQVAARAVSDVVIRPLVESGAHAELWLVWHEARRTPALDRFLKITTSAAPASAAR